jgi:hypothetical protein
MRFIGNVAAWITAGIVAYVLAAIASHQVVLAGVSRYREVDVATNLSSTAEAVVAQPQLTQLLLVILIAFAIAFFVADLVKALLPVLAPVAYPVAGGLAIFAALKLMEARFGVMPVLGAQEALGLWLLIGAGVVGGIVFELLRPKPKEERRAARRRRRDLR